MRYYNNINSDRTSGHDEELERIMQRKMNELTLQGQRNDQVESGQSTATPITLTDHNFSEMVRKHPLLIVDFWAPWCGPCRMVSPVITELSQELAGKAVFGKLNVDENPMIASTFGIQSIPTIAIFKNGKAVDGIVGAASKSHIMSKLSSHISSNSASSGIY
ncbi:MAG TPA: thioredoxin [Nitrososphaeraceae archaeon]|jgi:thioredoxin 1|nr:thioredoxin [Nitrososphaeraceae archaeon]